MSPFPSRPLMPNAAKTELILASGSRFRRQMLEHAGLTFSVEVSTLDEAAARAQMARDTPSASPGQVALQLAAQKAIEVSAKHPGAVVIGSDQVLSLHGTIFGKPADLAAARAQLKMLRGQRHTLPTGVVLAQDGRVVWQHIEVVELDMRAFSDDFLDAYVAATGTAMLETVGGYMLESLGVQLFDRVSGDYFTVIGLPLLPLLAELRSRGILLP